MYEVIRQSVTNFLVSYKKYIFFSLIYTLLTSFIFVPVISFIFNRMLLVLGSGSLLNGDVFKIVLSVEGLVSMFLISMISVFIFIVQFGSLIIISQQTYFSKQIHVSEAVLTTLKKLPNLLRFSSIILIFILGIIIPFIELSPIPALLDFNITIYFTNLVYRLSNWLIFIYVVIIILLFYLLLRFIFTLHFIFIEDMNVWNGMKHSWQLTKKNKIMMIVNLFALNLLFFVVHFTVIRFLSSIPNMTEANMVGDLINNYLLLFSNFISLIFTILFIPLNIIVLTQLFYLFKRRNEAAVLDTLTIHRSLKCAIYEYEVVHFFKKRQYAFFAVVLVYVTMIFFINYTVVEQSDYLKWHVKVAAHRGDINRAPENTLASIQSAIELGVDAVEFDVMLTKDNEVVLHHDHSLKRTAGLAVNVAQLTYDELSNIYVRQKIDGKWMREHIPTLNDVLVSLKEENIHVMIDVKVSHSLQKEEIARNIVTLVNRHEMRERVYVQSFDYEVLQNIRELDPEIKIGQILYLSAGNLRHLDVDFYTVRQTMLSERLVENAHRLGREVWVWTVNISRNINEVLKYDIDGIITDYPERVLY